MFTANTLLILGAGASCDYGYPLGVELINEIIQNVSPDQSYYNVKLRESLLFYDPVSIDSFLYHYRHDSSLITEAKIRIAEVILRSSSPRLYNRVTTGTKFNWYSLFWDAIVSGRTPGELSAPGQNLGFNVITFNYDASLEYYFFSRVYDKHSMFSSEQKSIFLENLLGRIHHVYGCLEEFHPNFYGDPNSISIGHSDSADAYERAIQQHNRIHLINEREEADYEKLRELFMYQSQLVFLGFGFDDTNIGPKVLNLKSMLNKNIQNDGMKLEALKYTNFGNSEKINRKVTNITRTLGKIEVVKSVKTTYEALGSDFSLNAI